MKKRMSRFTAGLLASLMLIVSLASCAGGEDDAADTTQSGAEVSETPAVTETTADPNLRINAKDNLPSDLNYDNAVVRVLAMEELAKYDVWGEGEESADIIYDAVYNRNVAVEERLNIQLQPDIQAIKWQAYAAMVRNLVQGGDDTYDFMFIMGNASIQSGNDTQFMDLSDNTYIDFDQPWWWSEAMDELSLDGETYRYLVGDISLSHYMMSGATLFNKALYENVLGDPEELYKLVLDGGWTLDTLREYCTAAYQDVNGDGALNSGDIYGSIIGNPEILKQMEYATDLQRYTRDEKGWIQLAYDEERAIELTEKLCALLYETTGIEYRSDYTNSALFAQRNMVFFLERLRVATGDQIRNMEDDYGIIPLPKMDDKQQEYRALIHNNSEFIVIPKTAKDPSMSGAVIEALCAESYRSVVEVFYESALKLKYSRDAYSGQCIDLIASSARKNVLYEYNGTFGCGNLITDLVKQNSTNFASSYASSKTITGKIIQKFMENLEKEKQG